MAWCDDGLDQYSSAYSFGSLANRKGIATKGAIQGIKHGRLLRWHRSTQTLSMQAVDAPTPGEFQ